MAWGKYCEFLRFSYVWITVKYVWAELQELGYEDKMKPSEMLTIVRFIFHGSKISDKVRR